MGAKRGASRSGRRLYATASFPRDDRCSASDDGMPGPEDIEHICDTFERRVGTTRRRGLYPLRHDRRAPVFSGSDAVSFLVDNGHAGTREMALGIGRRMAYERALFWHETRDFDLEDDKNLFYKFVPAGQRVIGPSVSHYFSCELFTIGEEFEEGMIVGPNQYKNKTYKNTFVGTDAVTFLVSSRMARTRQDAVRIGQLLMEDYGIFQHVHKKHKFKDRHLLYRFVPQEQRIKDHYGSFQDATPIEEKAQLFKEVVKAGNSFSGSSAVDAMVDGGVVPSRTQAVLLGEKLASDLGLFYCIQGRAKTFLDRPDIYYTYHEGHGVEGMDGKVIDSQTGNGNDGKLIIVRELEIFMGTKDLERKRSAITENATKNDEGCELVTTGSTHGMVSHVSEGINNVEDLFVFGNGSGEMQSNITPVGKKPPATNFSMHEEELPDEMTRTSPSQHATWPIDRFGFILDKEETSCATSAATSAVSSECILALKTTEKELSVEDWKVLLDRCTLTESGAFPSASVKTVKHFMRIGLPDSLRRQAWTVITGINAKIREREGDYQAFVKTAIRLMEEESYEHVLQRAIERDLRRTFPRHFLFCDHDENIGEGALPSDDISTSRNSAEKLMPDGLVSLRHILYAYSIYDNEVGYCQGMNFIAAMFLTFLSEEESFWLLVTVMNEEPYGMRGLFGKDMSGFHETLHVAEKVIQKFLPKLYRHLQKENVEISMFATQWILTIFTSTFSFDLVSRVWDSYIVEGQKVMYRVMLSLLVHAQHDLLGLDLERILLYFRDEFPLKVDGSSILKASLKIPLRQKHIRKYTNEWRSARNGRACFRRSLSRRSESTASAESKSSSMLPVKQLITTSGVGENGKHLAKKLLPGSISFHSSLAY